MVSHVTYSRRYVYSGLQQYSYSCCWTISYDTAAVSRRRACLKSLLLLFLWFQPICCKSHQSQDCCTAVWSGGGIAPAQGAALRVYPKHQNDRHTCVRGEIARGRLGPCPMLFTPLLYSRFDAIKTHASKADASMHMNTPTRGGQIGRYSSTRITQLAAGTA